MAIRQRQHRCRLWSRGTNSREIVGRADCCCDRGCCRAHPRDRACGSMPFILAVLRIARRVPRFRHPCRRRQIAGCVYPSPSPVHSAHVGAKWMYIIDGNRILAREFVFAVSNSGRQVHCCGYIGLDGHRYLDGRVDDRPFRLRRHDDGAAHVVLQR